MPHYSNANRWKKLMNAEEKRKQGTRVCRQVPSSYPGGISSTICETIQQEPVEEPVRRRTLSNNNLSFGNNYSVPSSPRSPFGNNGRASFGPSTVRLNPSRKNRNRKNRSRKNRSRKNRK